MKILKVAVGNASEAFIENAFSDGLNIISSDDNNKGKTIVIQAMMFALGNTPTFPASFEYRDYYYYVEFEENGKVYQICRAGDNFALKEGSYLWILNTVSELKRYWDKYISKLPTIVKNQLSRIVDPELYVQLFFVGQDKKDTSNIAHHGLYNKQDFISMLFAFAGLGTEQLPQETIDAIKLRIFNLVAERQLLLKQHKILKSKKTPVSYLSAESDRLAFGVKVENLERIQDRITELRKSRNKALTLKSKWVHSIKELNSLNRTISCGELRCMDCNSTNILFNVGGKAQPSYSFDVSTAKMREDIIFSINQKIASYAEEIERLSSEICLEQEKLQSIMSDENVSLESIVAYKKNIFSALDAQKKIVEIDGEIASLRSQLLANENSTREMQEKQHMLLQAILKMMNDFYRQSDPDGNITYTSLFTQQNQVYSGSDETIFHLSRLYALSKVLKHSYPIVIDSFRAEDLSTSKENTVLDLFKSLPNQMIFTTTLKSEELGKYDNRNDIHHINYKDHLPSKLLSPAFVEEFSALLQSLSITLKTSVDKAPIQ